MYSIIVSGWPQIILIQILNYNASVKTLLSARTGFALSA